MPIFTDLDAAPRDMDIDKLSQRVFTVGIVLQKDPLTMELHRHEPAQLIMVRRGLLTCGSDSGLWMVPPHGALWIPSGALHDIRAGNGVEAYCVFIDRAAAPVLPDSCCTLAVSPLLRELVIRSASFESGPRSGGMEERVFTLLLDEIAMAPIGGLHLPMPAEPRLRTLVDMIMADPSKRDSVAGWARRAGLSARSLARLLQRETGMSFGRWQRQLAVMLALQRLTVGASVQQVAIELGYESAGAFVAMFRKTLGASPARYVAKQQEALHVASGADGWDQTETPERSAARPRSRMSARAKTQSR